MLGRIIPITLFLLPAVTFAQGVNWELSDELDSSGEVAPGAEFGATANGATSTDSFPSSSVAGVLSEVSGGSMTGGNAVLELGRDEIRLQSGSTENEIIEVFGEPDERNAGSTQNVWRYGESRLFFAEGKLIAWTNQQDVLNRARLRGYTGSPGARGFKDPRWRNAWSLRERTTSSEVVDELIGSSSSDAGQSQSMANLELISGKSSTSSSEGSFSK